MQSLSLRNTRSNCVWHISHGHHDQSIQSLMAMLAVDPRFGEHSEMIQSGGQADIVDLVMVTSYFYLRLTTYSGMPLSNKRYKPCTILDVTTLTMTNTYYRQ